MNHLGDEFQAPKPPSTPPPPHEPDTLEALFKRVRARYAKRVERWVAYFGVPGRDRADVAQVAWMRIHDALPAYIQGFPLEPWLFTITWHAAACYHRRGYVRHETLAFGPDVAGLLPIASDVSSVEIRRDGASIVVRALKQMSFDERDAFLLVELAGVRPTEIAQLDGVPVSTVYSRLQRARAALKATVARVEAADKRRTGELFALPLFGISWRLWWERLRWLVSGRLVTGALVGGVVVYLLLRPTAPPIAQESAALAIATGSREAAAIASPVATTASAEPATDAEEPAISAPSSPTKDESSPSVPAGGAPGSVSKAGSSPPSPPVLASPMPRTKHRNQAPRSLWVSMAALEAATVLLRNGDCDEAEKRLVPYAAELRRGPLAPEYEITVSRIRACRR